MKPSIREKCTIFGDGGYEGLGDVLYAHFEQLEAVECIEGGLL